MIQISAKNLNKTYYQSIIDPGLKGIIKSVFKPEYKEIVAVSDVSFEIEKGKIIGFIGPNGAGKSTTIKMLSGILVPTSGKIRILDMDPIKDRKELTKKIGAVFGQRTQLWYDIPLLDTFTMLKYMYDIPEQTFKKNTEIFYDVLDIRSFMNIPVRQLSLGQRMRGEICAALLHEPEILFLDEPTIGLDIEVKKRIRSFLLEQVQQFQTTIILTTHDMGDIEKLCNDLIIIDKGELAYQGGLKNLKNQYFNYSKEVIVDRIDGIKLPKPSEYIDGLVEAAFRGDKISYKIDTNRLSVRDFMIRYLSELNVGEISIKDVEIEDVISRIYAG